MPKSTRILAACAALLLLAACGSAPVAGDDIPAAPTMQSGQALLPDWEHIPKNEITEEDEPPAGSPEQSTEKPEPKSDGKTENKTDKTDTKTENKSDKTDTKPDNKTENKPDPKPEQPVKQPEPTPTPTPTPEPEPTPTPTPTPAPTPTPEPEPEPEQEPTGYGTLNVIDGSTPVTGDTYEILCRVVQNEVGNTTAWESTKAMAVASYSYIKYYNDYLGRAPTLRLSAAEPGDRVKACVKEVLGQAVYYNGQYANCTYFSISCGVTTTAQSVWGTTQYPYLVSVDSSIEVGYSYSWSPYEKNYTFTAEQMAQKMNSALGTALDPVNDDPAGWLEITSRTDGKYVGTVRVGNTVTTGRKIRENILGLRSHAFDISYDEGSRSFTVTTYGYGHGVGMSQTGSMLYAQQGWDYVQILNHYYPGTVVK